MREQNGWTQYRPPHHADSGRPPNAALLIDFDNVTMGIRSDLQNQLKALLNSAIIKGKVAVQRAYADWRRYPQYIVPLSEASIDLIFAPAFGPNKKNATDIRLAIDALELVFTRPEIGTFILLSGDSDFASLVLKLKEYGKYVIGVGLRESSSDLLMQNCDEYYSYTELTGFQKEGEVEPLRRDPWELVVEAVVRMKKEGDVMRSDRLKQVMQSLDPSFDEKEAGFSRFSRFVLEAGQRGLLQLSKLDNGQYAVEVGTNANVAPEDEVTLRGEEGAAASQRASRGRRRRGGRRAEPAVERRVLALAEALELLRQALLVLDAVADAATDADAVRAKMVELYGDEGDPIFERRRFQRLLRQAHDAELIELVKDEEDVYRLKLRPPAVLEAEAKPSADAAAPKAEPEGGRRPRGRRGGRARGRTGRGRPVSGETEPEPVDESEPPPDEAAGGAVSDQAGAGAAGGVRGRRRNLRFRRGSRGGAGESPSATLTETPVSAVAVVGRPTTPTRPTLGPRLGSRRGGTTRVSSTVEADETESVAPATPETTIGGAAPAAPPPAEPAPAPEDGGGLLQRVSAALQRVVRGAAEPPVRRD